MQQNLRLRAPRDFERLRREGRAYHHPLLTLSLAPNGLPHNRYGFITGKSLGNAVVRNRARRLLREAARALHPHLRAGHDVVFIARRALAGQPYRDVERGARELVRRAGLVESDLLS